MNPSTLPPPPVPKEYHVEVIGVRTPAAGPTIEERLNDLWKAGWELDQAISLTHDNVALICRPRRDG
jgi:hypothetical protein